MIEGSKRHSQVPLSLKIPALGTAICGAMGIVFSSATASVAADWMLRVQTMGRVCHVQLKTASPLGEDFKGPFSSRKLACQEGANQFDGSLSDQSSSRSSDSLGSF